MLINTHPNPRIVDDYDIVFSNGLALPITVDTTTGDSIELDAAPTFIRVHYAPKPSALDPEVVLASEEFIIYTKHLLYINHRTREVLPASPEQREQLKATTHKLHKTVQ